jgi:hypothetical protein
MYKKKLIFSLIAIFKKTFTLLPTGFTQFV